VKEEEEDEMRKKKVEEEEEEEDMGRIWGGIEGRWRDEMRRKEK